MKIARLSISNFRGIKNAEFHFDGHVGKSTVCEALDLVLGPDRLKRRPPSKSLIFHNAQYLIPSEALELPPTPNPIRIEIV